MVEIEDVPISVWTSVYIKWKDALETGWYDELWTMCALCNFVNKNCLVCPLYNLDIQYCVGHAGSTLCKDYYESEGHWKITVRGFLQWLEDNTTVKTSE